MKIIYTTISALCLLLFSSTALFAQQGTAASGGEASGFGGTVSYTIGQTDYITVDGNGNIITQGIQQPYEIAVVTGMDETNISLDCAVYPNPTTDYVVLTVQKGDLQNMSFGLFDINGRLLMQERLTNASTTVSMIHFENAMYLFKVFNNDTEVKSFKVIKNQ